MALDKQLLTRVAVYAGSFAVGIGITIGYRKITEAYHNSYKQRRKRVIHAIEVCEYNNNELATLIVCFAKELKELKSQIATLAIDDQSSADKIELLEYKIEGVKKCIIDAYTKISYTNANICLSESKYNLTDEEIDKICDNVSKKYKKDYSIK